MYLSKCLPSIEGKSIRGARVSNTEQLLDPFQECVATQCSPGLVASGQKCWMDVVVKNRTRRNVIYPTPL